MRYAHRVEGRITPGAFAGDVLKPVVSRSANRVLDLRPGVHRTSGTKRAAGRRRKWVGAVALVVLSFCAAGQPARAGWLWGAPTTLVRLDSGHRNNIFYQGGTSDPVRFNVLNPGAVSYSVRDYNGTVVDSGAVNGSVIAPNVSQLGWYKLYLFGANQGGVWQDAVGSTTFCIFRRDARFPDFPTTFKSFTRVDPVIDFAWNGASPGTGVPEHGYHVAWEGAITAPYTENFMFYTGTDYGCKVWVNGQLLVDHSVPDRGKYMGYMNLVAGQTYQIRMEYVENSYAGGQVHLLWQSASQAMSPVPGPFTGNYYDDTYYVSADGAHDDALHAVIGAGLQRMKAWDADNGESLAAAMNRLSHDITICKAMGVPIMIAFSDGTTTAKDGKPLSDADRAAQMDKVRQIVTRFKGDVKVWEGRNEPNFGVSGRDFAINEAKPFYDLVKSIDPSAKVIGPGTVEINARAGWAFWIEDFLTVGGGNSIDGFSFHAYNSVNGDANLARRSMAALNVLLARYGLANMEKWQTEQGYFAAKEGVYEPRHQGRWTMLQKMIYAQQGIPLERDHLWYDKSSGYWAQPMWIENDDGSLNPEGPLMRVWSEELLSTNFSRALDFGANGNNLMLGSLFQSSGKNVAVFTTTGALNMPVELQLSNNNPVKVVDAWGKSSTQTPVNNRLTITVSELPVYVEAASNQTLNITPFNWGTNLARGAQFSYTSGVADAPYYQPNVSNGANKLGDGLLESWYLADDERPWISNQSEISLANPVNIEVQLPAARTVNRAVISATAERATSRAIGIRTPRQPSP